MPKKMQATDLAKQLAHNLFNSVKDCPTHVCADTGMVIEPSTDYMKAYDINPCAMGAYYEVFGFYYILCFDMEEYDEYVAIHDSEGEIVGTMVNSNEVRVGKWIES